MTTKPQPDRLLDAREWIGFSRADVTAALGWPPELIADLENGAAEPSAEQLELLGWLYRRPVPWFSGESHYEPSPGVLRMLEKCPTEGDRAVVAEFAEWLAGAGPAPRVRLRNGEPR